MIKNLKVETKDGQYGPYRQFVFQDGISSKWVYASEKRGFTDDFRVGKEIDIDSSYIQEKKSAQGRFYLSIKWPTLPNANPQGAPSSQDLALVHKKLDQIILILTESYGELPAEDGLPTDTPPPPSDDDVPY